MGQDPDVDMHSTDGPVAHAVIPEEMHVPVTVSHSNDVPGDERDDGTILNTEEEGGENVVDSEKHDIFEYYLQGWEAVAKQSEEYCASNPSGHGQFTPNRVFTSIQDLVQVSFVTLLRMTLTCE